MKKPATYRLPFFFFLPLLMVLSGCYDMTVKVIRVPVNTPPAESIYISGNFNNWDPGDPNYVLKLGSDSVYEVKLPRGFGDIEYKFTRGDWSTVEKDRCGFEISNRVAYYGRDLVLLDTIRSWNDLPKPGCPSITLIIDSLPEYPQPSLSPASPSPPPPPPGQGDIALFFASNINNWDPGSRYWMFTKGPDGKYYIEIPRVGNDEIDYKITRGSWQSVECAANGEDIDNRVLQGEPGQDVRISIQRWKDR
jgi:hypothetical protein